MVEGRREQTVTDKRILISPDACVAPKSLQSASTLVAGPSDGAARKTVPSPPSGRGHRGSGRPVLPGTMLGLLGEHTSAQDSLKILANNVLPNHLVIASTSLEDSEASKSQHIQNGLKVFLHQNLSITRREQLAFIEHLLCARINAMKHFNLLFYYYSSPPPIPTLPLCQAASMSHLAYQSRLLIDPHLPQHPLPSPHLGHRELLKARI